MSLLKSGRGLLLRWWVWLAPPHSCDEEQMRIGRAVRLLAVSGVLGIVPPLLLQWLHGWMEEFWTLAGTELALLGAIWLNHREYVQWAARTLTFTAVVCSAGLVYFSGQGYHDLSLLLFPVILVIAALLLSCPSNQWMMSRSRTVSSTKVIVCLAIVASR